MRSVNKLERGRFLTIAITFLVTMVLASCAVSVSQDNSISAGNKAAVSQLAAGSFNYGEALQKAIMFYEFQRSGKLPANTRNNWRGDSGLTDGADVGLDLTGGWYDAGDHVKFNLPMAYTAAMLSWSAIENKDAYVRSGQMTYILDNIKWATDYLIRCHPTANEYYYQVGDGNKDHAWWGPAEVMQMARPSAKVSSAAGGSTVVGETAAALAAAAVAFKDSDPAYSALCLSKAKSLYTLADTTRSDVGYTAASGFYNSWSGFYDELTWAATWIYLATSDAAWLAKAESFQPNWHTESQSTTLSYKWVHNWDDVQYGALMLLAKITGKTLYKEAVERNIDYWSIGLADGTKGTKSPKGLAFVSQWGSLRYATTIAYMADLWADSPYCTATKVQAYKDFAKSQVDYALGSTGRSFEIGFGVNPPQHPHHRTAHGSWTDSQSNPTNHRHVLVGALVGGPLSDDSYNDSIGDYVANEVACDYNAGFVGALARMYDQFGGTPIPNYKAIEPVTNNEMFVSANVNATGQNFVEIKALMNNQSGWPARMGDKLAVRYFIDISEFVAKGYSAADFTLAANYNQVGAKVTGLHAWDVAKNIYYVLIDFTGAKIYPGGQSASKAEIQFRIAGPLSANFWDSSNDWSYQGIGTTPGGSAMIANNIPVYDNGVLVFGKVPDGNPVSSVSSAVTSSSISSKSSASSVVISSSKSSVAVSSSKSSVSSVISSVSSTVVSSTASSTASQKPGALKVQTFQNGVPVANQVNERIQLVNTGTSSIALSTVKVRFFIKYQGNTSYSFSCDYSPVGSANVIGTFAPLSPAPASADAYNEISFTTAAGSLAPGASVEIQGRFWKGDWSTIDNSLNYSYNPSLSYTDWNKVTAYINGSLAWGVEPNGSTSSSSTVSSVISSSKSSVKSSSSTAISSSKSSVVSSVSSKSSASSVSSTSSSSSSTGVVYTEVTAPFTFDGAGTKHWKIAVVPNYINCWNLSALTINGVSFLNLYVGASQLPAKQNGYYYIDYTGPYNYSHIEIK